MPNATITFGELPDDLDQELVKIIPSDGQYVEVVGLSIDFNPPSVGVVWIEHPDSSGATGQPFVIRAKNLAEPPVP